MRRLTANLAMLGALLPCAVCAEKLTLAHVAINPSQGMLHLAKDSGMLAKYGFTADVILIPGTPRTIQAQGRGPVPRRGEQPGHRHLREMMHAVRTGCRAVLVFCAQRGDVSEVRPADEIDPDYGATMRQALAAGVEAIAYRAAVNPSGIVLAHQVPVVVPAHSGANAVARPKVCG